MPNYVLTGTPGAGKTAILRHLERDGFRVVEEAATDVIALEHALGRAEPSACAGFADKIVDLQRRRERLAGAGRDIVFFDRSPVCTLALSRFLGQPASPLLTSEVDRVLADGIYGQAAFFVRSQGFVTPTAARRISAEDALAFEDVHEQTYRELGFALVDVQAGPLARRAELVRREAEALERAPAAGARGRVAGGYGANQVSGSSATSPAPADASAPTTSVRRWLDPMA